MSKIKALFIVGPTASGKTDLSIKSALKFGGEIVSADSMQIYKGIHIASAAPSVQEMQGIRHHLLEFLDTSQQFSVAEYVIKAREIIKDIHKNGKLPIIVGGTGLYINALLDNTEFIDSETDLEVRSQLEAEFDQLGGEEMLYKLSLIDWETAKRLHPNDRKRIIRAFEVYTLTGKTVTEQNEASHNNEPFIEPLVIGITYNDREKLYDRINKRVDIMLQNGLLEEAYKSYKSKLTSGGFQAIGHKEFYPYFNGEITLQEATENLKQQTRRYAKRQLTWFRKDLRINWVYPDTDNDIYSLVFDKTQKFLKGE